LHRFALTSPFGHRTISLLEPFHPSSEQLYVCRNGSTQELSADSCNERERQGIGKFKDKQQSQELGKFFDNFNDQKTRIVMESSCVWYNVYRYLSDEKRFDVVLSNPIKTREIASAKIKTDKLDAIKLANLLRLQ